MVLGFGSDVPTFMLLPTRASRLERLARASVDAVVQGPARVVPIASAPAVDPAPVVAGPVEVVAEPVMAGSPSPVPAERPLIESAPDPVEAPVPTVAGLEPFAAPQASAVPEAHTVAVAAPEIGATQETPSAPEPDIAAGGVDVRPATRPRAPRRASTSPKAPRVRKAPPPVVAEAVPDSDVVAIRTYRPARDPAVKRAAHSPAVPAKRSRRLLGGKVELLQDQTAASEVAAGAAETSGTTDETAPE